MFPSLVDDNIHLLPFFGQSNPSIAPTAPKTSTCELVPGRRKRPALRLAIAGTLDATGTKFPGMLFGPGAGGKSVPRPILANTGNASLEFAYTPDANTLLNGNAEETDVKFYFICPDGTIREANCSLQRIVATGEIDVDSGATPGWVDTKLRIGPLAAYRRHKVRIVYSFDIVAHTFRVVSYACNGVTGLIPTYAAPMPIGDWLAPLPLGGAYPQIQPSTTPVGGAVSSDFDYIRLRYW